MIEVIEGNCFEKNLNKKYALIITDPPYGQTRNEWDKELNFNLFWEFVDKNLEKNGVVIITAMQPFASKIILSRLNWFRTEWIWKKNRPTNHMNADKGPLRAHENILIFSENKIYYNPVCYAKRKNVKENRKATNSKNYGRNLSYTDFDLNKNKHPFSVIAFNVCELKQHPTQKPVNLFQYLISSYSKPGDWILDPFAGAGTTGMACKRIERNATLIEMNAEYCNIIKKNIEDDEHEKQTTEQS